MADILIRGMEMPTSCADCELAKHFDGYNENECPFNAFSYYDCPLVPIPEGHGRLIDADDLIDEMALAWDYDQITNAEWTGIREWLNHAPTIVPAEGGGEDG